MIHDYLRVINFFLLLLIIISYKLVVEFSANLRLRCTADIDERVRFRDLNVAYQGCKLINSLNMVR